jgi:hypothetical protein
MRPNRQLSTSLARTTASLMPMSLVAVSRIGIVFRVHGLKQVRLLGGALRIGELGLVAARELVETGRIVSVPFAQ